MVSHQPRRWSSRVVTSVAAAALVACSANAGAPDETNSVATPLVQGSDGAGGACFLPAADDHARCNGVAEYSALYQAIQPSLDTGTDDRAAAEAICGRYLVRHGTGQGWFGSEAAFCGKCPEGSDGCQPSDFKMGSGFQKDPVTGHWTCGGTNAPSFKYTCSRCVINGTACADASEAPGLSNGR